MVTVQILDPTINEKYLRTDDVQSSVSSLNLIYSIPKIDDIKKALQILDAKDWMNVEQFLNPWGAHRVTLVHLAAYRGNLKMLERAAALNADLYAVDKFGRCALHYAAEKGHIDTVRWILAHFATVVGLNGAESSAHPQLSLPDVSGNTPLHEAIRGRHLGVAKVLVDAGSNVDAQNEKLHTPLLLAGAILERVLPNGKSWYEKVVQILVSALASVNVSDPITGMTPLHHAVELNSYEAAKRLLDVGAKVDVSNKQGRTPLYIAACGGHLKCVRLLVDNGGSLASETKDGDTVIGALLKYGSHANTLVTDILDARVFAIDKNNDVILDFGVLAPQGELQMAVVSALIRALPSMKKVGILQHPLLEALLLLKWWRFRYFYYLLLALQYSFVILLTVYTLMFREFRCDPFFLRWALLVCACILLFNNLLQVIIVPKHYKKKFETWLSVICATMSVLVALAGDYILDEIIAEGNPEESINLVEPSEEDWLWILELTGFIIPFAVIQVQLTVAQQSEIGKYVLSFASIFTKLLRVLTKCCSLMSGLSIGFTLLFGTNEQFLGTWEAMKKIVGIMFGEHDYAELLAETDDKSYTTFFNRHDESGFSDLGFTRRHCDDEFDHRPGDQQYSRICKRGSHSSVKKPSRILDLLRAAHIQLDIQEPSRAELSEENTVEERD